MIDFTIITGGMEHRDILVMHRRKMYLAVGKDHEPELSDHDNAYSRWFESHVRDGSLYPFIAIGRDGRILGSCTLWLREEHPRPGRLAERVPCVHSMYVEDEARRNGIAKALTERVIAFSKSLGYKRILLHTSEEGRNVYEKVGFKPTNEMRLEIG